MNLKNENLFVHFYSPECLSDGPAQWTPSDAGREQFYRLESFGEFPQEPEPYFLVLYYGKRLFDFLCNEYRQMFRSGEWWGLHAIIQDWNENRWVLQHLLSWWKRETGKVLLRYVYSEDD